MTGKRPRTPKGCGRPWPVLAPGGRAHEVGWEGWVPLNEREPDQASRATPLVPGLALRRLLPCRGKTSDERALSASARTRVFHRDGRGRRQDAGRRAHVRAGDREAENPETPPCEGGLGAASPATGSSPAEATAAIADPCGSAPRADAAPLSNASGSAPSRTGRTTSRITVRSCQALFPRAG